MEDSLKIKVEEDEALFISDVDRLINNLVSSKGNMENHLYFQQTFPKYMRQLQQKAQSLVEKYSFSLTREELIPLKVSLQKVIEKGLERFHSAITSSKK